MINTAGFSDDSNKDIYKTAKEYLAHNKYKNKCFVPFLIRLFLVRQTQSDNNYWDDEKWYNMVSSQTRVFTYLKGLSCGDNVITMPYKGQHLRILKDIRSSQFMFNTLWSWEECVLILQQSELGLREGSWQKSWHGQWGPGLDAPFLTWEQRPVS